MNSLTTSNSQHDIAGVEKHSRKAFDGLMSALTTIAVAAQGGDYQRVQEAAANARKGAQELYVVNRQTTTTLKAVLLSYAEKDAWIADFLEKLEAIYPDVYLLLMTTEITVERTA
jgi:hypothetical protein